MILTNSRTIQVKCHNFTDVSEMTNSDKILKLADWNEAACLEYVAGDFKVFTKVLFHTKPAHLTPLLEQSVQFTADETQICDERLPVSEKEGISALTSATIRAPKTWSIQDMKYQKLAMQLSLMMKSDALQRNGDFASIAPRILAEKQNLMKEINVIDFEETDLVHELNDLNIRLALVKKKKDVA